MVNEDVEMLLIAALAAASFGLALPLRDREVRARWRLVADRLGLAFEPGRLLESDGMAGSLGPYPVRIDNMRRQGTRVAVEIGGLPSLRMGARHLWFFEGGERPDDSLDGLDPSLLPLLRQLGLARLYVLLLDAAGEARLDAAVYSAHLGVDRGELYLTCPERIDDPETLAVALGGLARLAEGLERPDHLAEHLSENARAALAPSRRRLLCFQLLVEHFPTSKECGRAAWTIQQSGASVDTPEALRLRLLALRHGDPDPAALAAAVDDALASTAPLMRAIGAEAAIGLPRELAIPRLVSAARDRSAVCAVTGLRLLGVIGVPYDPRVESTLLELLYRGEPCLRVDVVCGLGLVGGADAIGPLLELERVADPGLRRLCRHALERLQSRFPERQNGSLSLLGEGGELSEVE